MTLLVQKYGGSSLGTLERIKHVATRIKQAKQEGHDVVVIVSAMQGETDRLIQLAQTLTPEPNAREYDALVSTGEQVSMSLLAIALNAKECPAHSYTGSQIGIQTNDVHRSACIQDIKTDIIQRDLANGFVVIIAGFQGVNAQGSTTTLGRGGSDTTAVAVAAALNAAECQIYTDVAGVYTSDPRIIPDASLLSHSGFEEMLEMASLGAKVLQRRSVELAKHHQLPIRVLSTFTHHPGTLVTTDEEIAQKRPVSCIAFNREEAMITLRCESHQPGMQSEILRQLSDCHIEVDMIVQQAADFTLTLHRADSAAALKIIGALMTSLKITDIKSHLRIAKLSLVGMGMCSHPHVLSQLLESLGKEGIAVEMMTTSDIKISVMIHEADLERGVAALHSAFELNTLSPNKESFFIHLY